MLGLLQVPLTPPLFGQRSNLNTSEQKNEWLYAQNGMLGCISCRDVKGLGVSASRGLIS
ncbi:Hypothetical protein FKW44_011471 [Caligus rogercresseyi]|uniref:Uncharacterized protein n=1 Tax=Caligus rogercresseyi TaxID=217165 RepID=A0A7T8HJ92_CALRO|nr:Hypothetical protein FKW44_011471 [Caligus rogercresseyi]